MLLVSFCIFVQLKMVSGQAEACFVRFTEFFSPSKFSQVLFFDKISIVVMSDWGIAAKSYLINFKFIMSTKTAARMFTQSQVMFMLMLVY